MYKYLHSYRCYNEFLDFWEQYDVWQDSKGRELKIFNIVEEEKPTNKCRQIPLVNLNDPIRYKFVSKESHPHLYNNQ
jgi:hypothetical protein